MIEFQISPRDDETSCYLVRGKMSAHCNRLQSVAPLVGLGGPTYMMFFKADDINWSLTSNQFRNTSKRVATPVWINPDFVQQMVDANWITNLEAAQILEGRPSLGDEDLMFRGMLRGCEFQAYGEDNPLARLSGQSNSLRGFVLRLPNSPDRHYLTADGQGRPKLDPAAREALFKFLGS